MVLPVSAVSFTVMLALTEMWLKPSRDMPSRGQTADDAAKVT